jgi:hypothetical protein
MQHWMSRLLLLPFKLTLPVMPCVLRNSGHWLIAEGAQGTTLRRLHVNGATQLAL